MKHFFQGIDRLNQWMMAAAGIMLAGMILLILFEIFLWNAFEATTLIADEYSAYVLAIMVFWGAGYTLRENGHIRITLILNMLPPRLSQLVVLIATGVTTVFMGYLVYYLYRMIASTYRYGSTSGTLTNTPLWIPQAIMLLGGVAFFLQLLASTLRAAQEWKADPNQASTEQ